MPWKAADAKSHTKAANTPRRQRMWAHVANGVAKDTGNEGQAVREANAVVKKDVKKHDSMREGYDKL